MKIVAALGLTIMPIAALASDSSLEAARGALTEFLAAYEAEEYAAIETMRPPKQLAAMIKASGETEKTYLANSHSRLEKAHKHLAIGQPRLVEESLKFERTSQGRAYVVAKTETYRRDLSGYSRVQRPILVLEDNGTWFVTRVSEPLDVLFLRIGYPEFAEIGMGSDHSETISKEELPAAHGESEQ